MNHANLHHSAPAERRLPQVAVGRVKRSYLAENARTASDASNDNQFHPVTAAEALAAWAARSAAASGFGDAAVSAGTHVTPIRGEGAFAGGAAISASLKEIVASIIAGALTTLRRGVAAWRRSRGELATLNALRALDAKTLRDLGIDPSEVRSLAVELSGASDPTRAHALMTLRHLSF